MHYMELLNVSDPAQRAEVALTMDEISNYVTLTPREVMIADELRRAMAMVFGRAYDAPAPAALGIGGGHAFGHPGRMRIRGPQERLEEWAARTSAETIARTEQLAGYGWRYRGPPTTDPLERVQDAIGRATEFKMLRGPGDAELAQAREHGYDPEPAARTLEAIRKREEELARYLKGEPVGPGRLAEYISARAWIWDLGDGWNAALADLGLRMTIEEVGRARIHATVAAVPIVAVESGVRQGRFRNGQYRWERNDIFDLGFIGHAVVCCDAVLTDKDVRRHVVDRGLDKRFGTTLLRDLNEIIAWLDASAPD
jgi:hypothetical protein